MKLCQNVVGIGVWVFWNADRRVANVPMETAQLILSQFKNF